VRVDRRIARSQRSATEAAQAALNQRRY